MVFVNNECYDEIEAESSVQMAFANPNHQVMSTLTKSRMPDIMGKQWFFVRMHDAVQTCLTHMQTRQIEVAVSNEGQQQQQQNNVLPTAFDLHPETEPFLSGNNSNV